MGCDVKETLYTIRWFATGDVELHLTISDVYREAFNNGGALRGSFIVKIIGDAMEQIIAAVTKEERE